MIYWYEQNPQMAAALAAHLRVPVPNGYIIFLPVPLEKRMEALEAQKAPGVKDDDILETQFKVIPAGKGYTVECLDVKTK